jgi:GntR family transcriptional regulator
MFVKEGAADRLLASERQEFLSEEWPAVRRRIKRLGLDLAELTEQA